MYLHEYLAYMQAYTVAIVTEFFFSFQYIIIKFSLFWLENYYFESFKYKVALSKNYSI